tara:strand:+ start:161 stop:1051 length:891 start_codon:yes stop_codon:yes gene_type:complete
MTTIAVPQSCQHSGLNLEEVEAYYSLTPVRNAADGYNYNKTISKILDVYLSTKTHSSKSSKNVKKFRLKEACLDSNLQKNSRVFRDFNIWRHAQISKYATNQNLDHDDTEYLREKLAKAELKIRQLKAENKLLKQQVLSNILIPDETQKEEEPEPEPVVVDEIKIKKEPEPVVVEKEPEPVKLEKVEFKMKEYYNYDEEWETDEERITHYFSRCQEAQEMCEQIYNNNYKCLAGKNDKNIADILETYTDWCDEEYEELSACIAEQTEGRCAHLTDKYYKLLDAHIYRMTKHPIVKQ